VGLISVQPLLPQEASTLDYQKSQGLRTFCIAVVLCVAYFLAMRIAMAFRLPPDNIAVFWPPNAVLLTALILTRHRNWWICFLAVVPAYFFSAHLSGFSAHRSAYFFTANCSEVYIAGILLFWFLKKPPHFSDLKETSCFILSAVIVGPAVAGCIVTLAPQSGPSLEFWQIWRRIFLGDALAHLTLTPFLTTLILYGKIWTRNVSRVRALEACGWGIGLVLVSHFAYGNVFSTGVLPVVLYAPAPLMLCVSIRFGVRGATSAIFAITIVSIWNAANGVGPFSAMDAAETVLSLQLFLFVLAVPMLLLATLITEREQAEKTLRQSEERLDLAIRGTLDGVWDANLLTGKEYWSPRFYELLGHKTGEISASFDNFQGLIHPADLERVQTAMQRHLEYSELYDIEFRLFHKSGNYIWVQSRGEAIRDKEGKPVRMAGAIRDISNSKHLEEEIRQHQEKLAHVARVSTMGEMATGIAHELNQSLAAIASYSFAARQHLEKPNIDTQHLIDICERLESQSIRAGDIVRQLRDFVNKSPASRVLIDMNQQVRDVARFVEPDLLQSEVTLELNLNEPMPKATLDEIQIQQVLVNLIRNAVDATLDVFASQRIVTVRTKVCENQTIEVSVIDAGKGLNDEELDQVFEAFFSTKETGMGMGLAISRSIIEMHAGTLVVEQNEGPGVTFRFCIPCEEILSQAIV